MDAIKKYSSFLIVALAILIVGWLLTKESGGPKENFDSAAKSAFESCRDLMQKETCYAKYFENLTNNTDRDYAFNVLRTLQKLDPEARGCHFIAHSITTAETRKDPTRWRELMNTAPSDCSYGAVHGALEVYASTFPNGKLPKEEIPSLCNNPDKNNCTHGLGHILLVINENNIPESLRDCKTLPHDKLSVFECLTGVFMERSTAANLVTHGLAGPEALDWPRRLPETIALCRTYSGIDGVACWKETVHVALVAFNNDFQKLAEMCESASEEEETRECIDHAIGVAAGSLSFDFTKTKAICDTRVKAADFKDRCYANLVSSTLSTIPQEKPAAQAFCSSLEPAYQRSCFQALSYFRPTTGD